jgi:beta-glucanase (GH16 family)
VRRTHLLIVIVVLLGAAIGLFDTGAASAHPAKSASRCDRAHVPNDRGRRDAASRRQHGRRRTQAKRCVPTTAAKSAAAPAADPSSTSPTSCVDEVLPAKPAGGNWTCVFDDEFDSATGDATALNTNEWTPQVSATSGYTTGQYPYYVCYENSPNNISVSGGALHLTIRKETTPVNCGGYSDYYTGGMVTSDDHFGQTYGRFEVRALLPQTTAAGLQETLWLWPVNDTLFGSWPGSGEVDFSEFYSEYSSLDIPVIHYDYNVSTVNASTSTNTPTTDACHIDLAQYNDYAVTWEPGSFTVTINGTTCLIDDYAASGLTGAEPFNQPFFIALTQALGIGTNAFNPSTTPLPATTSIQYVRVWK